MVVGYEEEDGLRDCGGWGGMFSEMGLFLGGVGSIGSVLFRGTEYR